MIFPKAALFSVKTPKTGIRQLAPSVLVAILFALASDTAWATGRVALIARDGRQAAVDFGVRELQSALEQRGWHVVEDAAIAGDAWRIFVGVKGESHLAPVTVARETRSDPESYSIRLVNRTTVAVEGSDPTGAMYGALELVDQVQNSNGNNLAIQPVEHLPFLSVRGVNLLLTPQGFDDPQSWYWSDSFWQNFLDMLARNRYNFIDLEGTYDLTVAFLDTSSYLVSLPDFPDVGVGPVRASKNIARFRTIVRMAADRGIKIGLMNYMTSPPIGPWQTGRFWKDERYARERQALLEPARVEKYTFEAVKTLLTEVPELSMLGFRIGEAGQAEDFYKRTYIEAVRTVRPSVDLYTRPWLAEPEKVRELAALAPGRFFIKPKYIGEALGLPYQAVTGGRAYAPSGSYEDYVIYANKYPILWHVLAFGTHRVFNWGSPEFVRRLVKTCTFGGVGLSLEPMHKYLPATDYLHNNPRVDHNFYKWMFEKQWFWYMVWGRIAYRPDVGDEVWLGEFRRRFGAQAGDSTFKAVVESSKIVPFVYAYHNQGLDHQEMAPEFETGDHALSARGSWGRILWTGSRVVPFGGGNDDYLSVGTLDRTAMADPATYVSEYLQQIPSGKMTPFEAALYLEKAAAESERLIGIAAGGDPSSKKEFECVAMDVRAVAALARYYAERTRSATHLAFYKATNDHAELDEAYSRLQAAAEKWDELAQVADFHFGYVPELIRMRTYQFLWHTEGRHLGIALEEINQLEEAFRDVPRSRQSRTVIGHVPPTRITPGRSLLLRATLTSGGVHLWLWYRNSGRKDFDRLVMSEESRFSRTWTATVPAEVITPVIFEYFFEADEGASGKYGSTLDARPPYRIPVTTDESRPVVEHTSSMVVHGLDNVVLDVVARDESGVAAVRVRYKRLPSTSGWLSAEMVQRGGDRYSCTLPVSAEGMLYYFEAVDKNGNATNYPNFLRQTPYFIIDPRR